MAFENLISMSFSQEELAALDQAIQNMESTLSGKTVNLTPEQRQQYGRIAEQNKLCFLTIRQSENKSLR
ncbi:hypothetical protein [Chryseobacterium defluvii]|uniref:Uncharacterized protein n=1 Tax=Chryseobacterium defluvii TaxID=160396 RepID=A0A495SNK9_9FLAO|nr:hypothetical protein [Chryseobacterium defluvii]RKT01627.1 hypothetical protein BCF58_0850 [Chryseobacterium defluvii]